jgi:DNA-directed RNA polymerase subunit RPC12/RpoP
MCIGMFKNAGDAVPTEETLKHCFDSNDDGAGFAYLTTKNTWAVKKGFMKFEDFIEAWNKEEFTKAHTVVAHFRIGTSGRTPSKHGEWGKGEMCTHPFPVSDVSSELEQLEYEAEQIVIHNGIVGKGEGFLSDTMVAIRDHISVLAPYIWKDDKVAALLEDLIDCGPRYQGSRWFIANGSHIRLLGGWEEDKTTGCMYTHTGYKAWPVARHGAYYNQDAWWNMYGADDDWGDNTETPFGKGDWVYKNGKWELKDNKKEPVFAYCPNDSMGSIFGASEFSWEEWYSWMCIQDGLADSIAPNEHEEDDDDDAEEEIYDANGTAIIALVDKFGNIIWDDVTRIETRTMDDDKQYHCSECGAANLSKDEIERDDEMNILCPFCHSHLMPWLEEEPQPDSGNQCPNCGEKHHIGTPVIDKGDTQCFRCGAIFLDTIKGEDSIVCWDEEIKALHEEIVGGEDK